jgi:antitoxin component YwqK of YwqJK toxin-antitoxin module
MKQLTLLLFLATFGSVLGQSNEGKLMPSHSYDDIFTRAGVVYLKSDSSLFSGKVWDWYDNKQPRSEWNYIGGIIHGVQRSWYKNGHRETEAKFKDGKPHGKRFEWYENGNKWNRSKYKNGFLHGRSLGWQENGILLYKETYKENERIAGKCFNQEGKKIPCTP